MPPELTAEAWAQIRHDYEHTDRPVDDICAGHGISAGTLRNRVRRWGWTRRRPAIASDGPPPAPPAAVMPAQVPAAAAFEATAPAVACPANWPAAAVAPAGTGGAIVPRLQAAVARVLPAIEATLATLVAGPANPREMERAARILTALTRVLSELNGLLRQHGVSGGGPLDPGEPYKDLETRRRELAAKLEAFVASRQSERERGGDAG